MEDHIPQKTKSHPSKLVKPNIPLARMGHNTPRDSTSGKYVITIPKFDLDTPEEWIIFQDLVQKSLRTQYHY